MNSLKIVIIEKNGNLRNLNIKDFDLNELFKKCGFKKSDNFINHVSWNVNFNGNLTTISLYGKTEGRHNNENKFIFPPPFDNKTIFGCCALVANVNKSFVNLNSDMWSNIYSILCSNFQSSPHHDDNQSLLTNTNTNDIHNIDVNSNSDNEDSFFQNIDPELSEEEYLEED